MPASHFGCPAKVKVWGQVIRARGRWHISSATIALTKLCLELEPQDRPRHAGVLAERVTGYLESVDTRLREAELERAAAAARADAQAKQAEAERRRAESETRQLEQEQQATRKLRKTIVGLAAVSLIAIGTSLIAGNFWNDADVSRRNAETSQANALKEAIRANEQRGIAVNNLGKADQAEKEAIAQRDAAQKAQLDAVDQTYVATRSEIRAVRFARQSGWRSAALGRLQSLVQLGSRNLDRVDLRTEALACLAEMDVRIQSRLNSGGGWHMEYSPDGQTLAVNAGQKISLQDLSTNREFQSIPKSLTLAPFAFHPSGTLAVPSAPGRVSFHPTRPGQPSFAAIVGDGHALSLAFSRSGDRLAVVWGDVSPVNPGEGHPMLIRQANVYETATGKRLWKIDFPPNNRVNQVHYKLALALSPAGQSLAMVGPNFEVRLFSVGKSDTPIVLGELDDRICAIDFHPDGQSIAAAGRFAGAVWDLKSNSELFRIHGPEGGFWDVAFSPDGQFLAGVTNDEIVRLWDSKSGREPRSEATPSRGNPFRAIPIFRISSNGQEPIVDVAAVTTLSRSSGLGTTATHLRVTCVQIILVPGLQEAPAA
jgi:WD domain, G-beta repeat